ncbi:HK97 gp10 family phage protein [Oceanobacillus massiliensis]|uniref:HK97 gp10 family phage protein n=1 Tax=Oceanobacillus massiliensis TaxID=1465765 RepID=UPI000287F6C2|nr:HK97 gp10 family phage protein [Oceanobacillus massiliensis]
MAERVTIDEMAQEIMDGLLEYANLASDEMKKCVRAAGTTVRKEIKKNAPVDTGKYRDSWTVTKQKESSSSLELVVHSKTRYQLAHLLEHGHAKRGGGRVAGKVHIAPAEELGERELVQNIERRLRE